MFTGCALALIVCGFALLDGWQSQRGPAIVPYVVFVVAALVMVRQARRFRR